MTTVPVLVLLTAAVGLGLVLGMNYLRGVRSKPVLNGLHLLIGAGALEQIAMVLHGTPNGETVNPGTFGNVAAALVAATMFLGLAAALLASHSRRATNVVLATHAGVGAAGFVMFLVWVANL